MRWRAGIFGLVLLAVSGCSSPTNLRSAPSALSTGDDRAALVDPLIGTGSGGVVVGNVDAFPGVSAPFGMIQWSPDTPSRPPGGGYWYGDRQITGFSLTHLSGPGCAVAGDIPFLPWVGALPSDPGNAAQPFSHADEIATPGYYAVTLGGIRAELTTTVRSGLGRFTYPASASALMLVKVAGSQGGSANASFTIVGNDEIVGAVQSGGFCGQPNAYTLYFAAQFDRPFTVSGTFSATAGGYVAFDTTTAPTVRVKTAISYVSIDGARANLEAEAMTFDLDEQAARAKERWNAQLGKLKVVGGTLDQRKQLYTALYHSLLHPNVFSDADGRYIGFDGKVRVTRRPQYANYSGWDIYRSEIPLLALLAPVETSDMMASLLRDGDQMGWLPKWPVANGETGVMNGDSVDPILASAYAFGARAFDVRRAVELMVHGAEEVGAPGQGWYVERPKGQAYLARGYVPNTQADSISPEPNGASETLEYAIDDFAISRLAWAIGEKAIARRFHQRSQNWANLFDTATGYIRPRDGDGAFPPGLPLDLGSGFGQSGFQEGNAAQYTFMIPHDLAGLFFGLGGTDKAQARLDDYFTALNVGPNDPHQWQGNEPNLGTPWAYDSAGAPWKTQALVRKILTTLYSATPGGEPGNDDLGSMSSWYVWAAIGLYPQTPGVPMLVLGSPLFEEISIDAGAGRRIEIHAPGAATDRPYVHALRLNGRAYNRPWVRLGDDCMTLDYALDSTPDPQWGAQPEDAPPSFPAGPLKFPPTTRAFLTTNPTAVRLTPGQPASVGVVVDNTLGADAATVSWQADGAVLAFAPATGTVTAAAGARASTPMTVSAASSTPSGYYQVAITAQAANGAILRTAHLLVSVVRPGESIPTAYVSNYSDNTVTPVDTQTGTAGPTILVGAGPDGVLVTHDNKEVYVANNNSNSVTVIDVATNTVIATVPVGSVAADLDETPDGKTVWVSNYGDGTVQPIDVATHAAGAPLTVGGNPQRLRISRDGKQLWVPDQGSGAVSVVDLATLAVHNVAVGAAPFGIAISPDSRTAFVGNTGSNSLSVVDTASLTVTRTVALGASPAGLGIAPDGHVLYVAVGTGGVLSVDPLTGTVGSLIATGSGAYAVSFNTGGALAWVVDSNTNDIRAIDVAGGLAQSPILVGSVPDGIGLTH
jgi:predicted alpha-1,2-mannosidase